MSPYGEATGGIFEIFQNEHIFLKFLFLKNIKKKKPPDEPGPAFSRGPGRADTMGPLVQLFFIFDGN